MQKLCIAGAVLGTAIGAVAQCQGVPPNQTILSADPFSANFYVGSPSPVPAAYTGFNLLFDLNATCDITVNDMETWLYDQGAGNPVNPNQVGNTANVNIYTCAGTYLGNETTLPGAAGSPWTLAGTGTVVVDAFPTNSIITLNAPIAIAQGLYGVAVEFQPPTGGQPNEGPLHPLIQSPAANPTPGDLYINISNMGVQNDAFVGAGVTSGDSFNLQFGYTPNPNAGFTEVFGDGCYFRPFGHWEEFNTNAALDLSGFEYSMLYQGAPAENYQMVPAALSGPFVPPASANIMDPATVPATNTTGDWDDALAAPITLPFAFPFAGGGSTNEITIGSNGFVFLGNVTDNSRCFAYYNSFPDFRDFEPRIAMFFGDLDPQASGTAGGGVYYDVINPNEVRITFENVHEWNDPAAVNTFQLVLQSSGNYEVIYQGMAIGTAPAIVGFTRGNGDRTENLDLTARAAAAYVTGDGAIPPVLNTDFRPVIGTTLNWFLEGITPGTPIVFLITGVAALPGPLDLTFLGMPNCRQYIDVTAGPADTWLMNIDTNTWTATQPIPIPNNPALIGANLYAQAAPFTAGLNRAGILSSNGACVKVGAQ